MRHGRARLALFALSALTVIVGCSCGGGDDTADATVDTGTPLGEGIVKEVTGSLAEVQGGAAEGKGELLLDVFHGDRAVNKKVKVSLARNDAREVPAGKGEGNQAFGLDAGLYFASIRYSEGELARDMEGTIAGLKVNPGKVSKYVVQLEAPVGLLQMKCMRTDGPGRPNVKVDEETTLEVFAAEGDRSTPVWSGTAGGSIPLPVGSYRVKATYDGGSELPTIEWYPGIEIAAGMAKTVKDDCLFDLDSSGVRIDAFNFSFDVNGSTQVYFFNPGANVEQATAKASGPAGENIPVSPGAYDVLIVYVPSADNPDLQTRKKLEDFEVPERGGVRRQVDLVMELGEIMVQVKDGDDDVSERVEMRVKRAGADPIASSSILEIQGVGQQFLEAGTYDIYLDYEPSEGDPIKQAFQGVELGTGFVWRQEFDVQQASWLAKEVERPATPWRPLDWKEPSSDDDDSGGADDDDSAGGEAAPAEEAPAEEAPAAEPAQ
jgi:hypothetical protein